MAKDAGSPIGLALEFLLLITQTTNQIKKKMECTITFVLLRLVNHIIIDQAIAKISCLFNCQVTVHRYIGKLTCLWLAVLQELSNFTFKIYSFRNELDISKSVYVNCTIYFEYDINLPLAKTKKAIIKIILY